MLFINPHLPFFGPGQVYEGHVHSEEGWNFTGYTRFGFPLPMSATMRTGLGQHRQRGRPGRCLL